jgi:hypothetical protein
MQARSSPGFSACGSLPCAVARLRPAVGEDARARVIGGLEGPTRGSKGQCMGRTARVSVWSNAFWAHAATIPASGSKGRAMGTARTTSQHTCMIAVRVSLETTAKFWAPADASTTTNLEGPGKGVAHGIHQHGGVQGHVSAVFVPAGCTECTTRKSLFPRGSLPECISLQHYCCQHGRAGGLTGTAGSCPWQRRSATLQRGKHSLLQKLRNSPSYAHGLVTVLPCPCGAPIARRGVLYVPPGLSRTAPASVPATCVPWPFRRSPNQLASAPGGSKYCRRGRARQSPA